MALPDRHHQPPKHERQEQREDMPAEQQSRAYLHQELEEAVVLNKKDHSVENQQNSEKIHAHFRVNHVIVIQAIVRREGYERRRQSDHWVGREPAERRVCEDYSRAEEQQ